VGCDVRDFRELVGVVADRPRPDAIFSNSDHLQAQTALAAAYLGLPGKDWRAALRAKNKALMRRHLATVGLDAVAIAELPAGEDPAALAGRGLPYPLVVKPREGVASEDVFLVHDAGEVVARATEIRARRPNEALLVEEFLAGELRTFETVGDGRTLHVLGGFRTTLSAPPHFVEERLEWAPDLPQGAREALLAQLGALGAGFGACHTEFVLAGAVPRLIEVNYRLVGDQVDLLVADLLGVPLFEQVLRVHLGERLSGEPPLPAGHALADYVVAGRAGTLAAAPGPVDVEDGGVRLRYRPLRPAGDRVELSHTNRDYLGVIRATGPDRLRVEAAVAAFRARSRWEIVP
jgi:biotin carboxylase